MQPRHLPVLDGLRALAVLLVLWCHVPQTVAGYPEWLKIAVFFVGPGGLGVEIFFVLSGFLITRILVAERQQGMPVRWFLLRRLLRIFPIYYLLLLVMLPFRPAAEIGWCALYLYNLKSILAPEGGPLEHTWSLCIEEHFYLLWPMVVAFAPRASAPRILALGVLPLAIVGAWVVGATVEPADSLRVVQHGSPFRFLSLAPAACSPSAKRGCSLHRVAPPGWRAGCSRCRSRSTLTCSSCSARTWSRRAPGSTLATCPSSGSSTAEPSAPASCCWPCSPANASRTTC